MIRENESRQLTYGEDGVKDCKLSGLSTDTADLPTEGIATGSLYLEVDTGDVYAFAEGDTPAWHKIASLGGGS